MLPSLAPCSSIVIFLVVLAGCSSGDSTPAEHHPTLAAIEHESSTSKDPVPRQLVSNDGDAADTATTDSDSDDTAPQITTTPSEEIEADPVADPEPDVVTTEPESEKLPHEVPGEYVASLPDVSEPEVDFEEDRESGEVKKSQISLTNEEIDDFANGGYKKDVAKQNLAWILPALAEKYDLGKVDPEAYEYVVHQIDIQNEAEWELAKKTSTRIFLEHKLGRPTQHNRRNGRDLPSMRLGLLKFLIDRSTADDGFNVSAWLAETQRLEKKLDTVSVSSLESRKANALVVDLDVSLDMWFDKEAAAWDASQQVMYDISANGPGGIRFNALDGMGGAVRRTGNRAALIHSQIKSYRWRAKHEMAKHRLDLLVGSACDEALTDSEKEHLRAIWDAGVLLNPRMFYRVMWMAQYQTDVEIDKLTQVIEKLDHRPQTPYFVSRAELFAKKGTQPFMVYHDFREAFERDSSLRLDDELLELRDTASETLQMHIKNYKPDTLRDLHLQSLHRLN